METQPNDLDQAIAAISQIKPIEDPKALMLERVARDVNRMLFNQVDQDYAESFKANLNMEYLGYVLEGITAYLEAVETQLDPVAFPQYFESIAESSSKVSEKIQTIMEIVPPTSK